ncbi:hypothetical protein M5K25_027816 [Dendrobium thyrsiflorum]|uniref:Uncharacterized protein n=1 Tax=Dendrobium thyrsiflorum TaxID=117978 RepID=A0ABD0TUT2_DENTH
MVTITAKTRKEKSEIGRVYTCLRKLNGELVARREEARLRRDRAWFDGSWEVDRDGLGREQVGWASHVQASRSGRSQAWSRRLTESSEVRMHEVRVEQGLRGVGAMIPARDCWSGLHRTSWAKIETKSGLIRVDPSQHGFDWVLVSQFDKIGLESMILYCLDSLFGHPLEVDNATVIGSRPSIARVMVELNITKQYCNNISLGPENMVMFKRL